MQSRARLLLEKEQFKMKKDPVWGITAQPLNVDDWFTWEATIKGPKDTLWEGGIFKLFLQFNENYNSIPPKIYFHTVPFHPNVDPVSGVPCLDFLDNLENWKEYYSINYMLLGIQMMLSNPVLDDAVNVEAAKMCRTAPTAYKQMILENVLASKRVDAGLKPHLEDDSFEVAIPEKQDQQAKNTEQNNKGLVQIGKISFDDYHSLWSGIATTRPAPTSKNPLNDILKSDSKLQAAHFGMEQQELQEEIKKQIVEHNSLMYGKFDRNAEKPKDLQELKATRINMLKQIYLPNHQGPDKSMQSALPSSSSLSASKELEPSEQEVQDLLNWSSNLDNSDAGLS